MNNQHKKIKDYRDLSQQEIDTINLIKEKAVEAEILVNNMLEISEIDHRWLSIGKTDLQKGFMALVRSVAKPESF